MFGGTIGSGGISTKIIQRYLRQGKGVKEGMEDVFSFFISPPCFQHDIPGQGYT